MNDQLIIHSTIRKS